MELKLKKFKFKTCAFFLALALSLEPTVPLYAIMCPTSGCPSYPGTRPPTPTIEPVPPPNPDAPPPDQDSNLEGSTISNPEPEPSPNPTPEPSPELSIPPNANIQQPLEDFIRTNGLVFMLTSMYSGNASPYAVTNLSLAGNCQANGITSASSTRGCELRLDRQRPLSTNSFGEYLTLPAPDNSGVSVIDVSSLKALLNMGDPWQAVSLTYQNTSVKTLLISYGPSSEIKSIAFRGPNDEILFTLNFPSNPGTPTVSLPTLQPEPTPSPSPVPETLLTLDPEEISDLNFENIEGEEIPPVEQPSRAEALAATLAEMVDEARSMGMPEEEIQSLLNDMPGTGLEGYEREEIEEALELLESGEWIEDEYAVVQSANPLPSNLPPVASIDEARRGLDEIFTQILSGNNMTNEMSQRYESINNFLNSLDDAWAEETSEGPGGVARTRDRITTLNQLIDLYSQPESDLFEDVSPSTLDYLAGAGSMYSRETHQSLTQDFVQLRREIRAVETQIQNKISELENIWLGRLRYPGFYQGRNVPDNTLPSMQALRSQYDSEIRALEAQRTQKLARLLTGTQFQQKMQALLQEEEPVALVRARPDDLSPLIRDYRRAFLQQANDLLTRISSGSALPSHADLNDFENQALRAYEVAIQEGKMLPGYEVNLVREMINTARWIIPSGNAAPPGLIQNFSMPRDGTSTGGTIAGTYATNNGLARIGSSYWTIAGQPGSFEVPSSTASMNQMWDSEGRGVEMRRIPIGGSQSFYLETIFHNTQIPVESQLELVQISNGFSQSPQIMEVRYRPEGNDRFGRIVKFRGRNSSIIEVWQKPNDLSPNEPQLKVRAVNTKTLIEAATQEARRVAALSIADDIVSIPEVRDSLTGVTGRSGSAFTDEQLAAPIAYFLADMAREANSNQRQLDSLQMILSQDGKIIVSYLDLATQGANTNRKKLVPAYFARTTGYNAGGYNTRAFPRPIEYALVVEGGALVEADGRVVQVPDIDPTGRQRRAANGALITRPAQDPFYKYEYLFGEAILPTSLSTQFSHPIYRLVWNTTTRYNAPSWGIFNAYMEVNRRLSFQRYNYNDVLVNNTTNWTTASTMVKTRRRETLSGTSFWSVYARMVADFPVLGHAIRGLGYAGEKAYGAVTSAGQVWIGQGSGDDNYVVNGLAGALRTGGEEVGPDGHVSGAVLNAVRGLTENQKGILRLHATRQKRAQVVAMLGINDDQLSQVESGQIPPPGGLSLAFIRPQLALPPAGSNEDLQMMGHQLVGPESVLGAGRTAAYLARNAELSNSSSDAGFWNTLSVIQGFLDQTAQSLPLVGALHIFARFTAALRAMRAGVPASGSRWQSFTWQSLIAPIHVPGVGAAGVAANTLSEAAIFVNGLLNWYMILHWGGLEIPNHLVEASEAIRDGDSQRATQAISAILSDGLMLGALLHGYVRRGHPANSRLDQAIDSFANQLALRVRGANAVAPTPAMVQLGPSEIFRLVENLHRNNPKFTAEVRTRLLDALRRLRPADVTTDAGRAVQNEVLQIMGELGEPSVTPSTTTTPPANTTTARPRTARQQGTIQLYDAGGAVTAALIIVSVMGLPGALALGGGGLAIWGMRRWRSGPSKNGSAKPDPAKLERMEGERAVDIPMDGVSLLPGGAEVFRTGDRMFRISRGSGAEADKYYYEQVRENADRPGEYEIIDRTTPRPINSNGLDILTERIGNVEVRTTGDNPGIYVDGSPNPLPGGLPARGQSVSIEAGGFSGPSPTNSATAQIVNRNGRYYLVQEMNGRNIETPLRTNRPQRIYGRHAARININEGRITFETGPPPAGAAPASNVTVQKGSAVQIAPENTSRLRLKPKQKIIEVKTEDGQTFEIHLDATGSIESTFIRNPDGSVRPASAGEATFQARARNGALEITAGDSALTVRPIFIMKAGRAFSGRGETARFRLSSLADEEFFIRPNPQNNSEFQVIKKLKGTSDDSGTVIDTISRSALEDPNGHPLQGENYGGRVGRARLVNDGNGLGLIIERATVRRISTAGENAVLSEGQVLEVRGNSTHEVTIEDGIVRVDGTPLESRGRYVEPDLHISMGENGQVIIRHYSPLIFREIVISRRGPTVTETRPSQPATPSNPPAEPPAPQPAPSAWRRAAADFLTGAWQKVLDRLSGISRVANRGIYEITAAEGKTLRVPPDGVSRTVVIKVKEGDTVVSIQIVKVKNEGGRITVETAVGEAIQSIVTSTGENTFNISRAGDSPTVRVVVDSSGRIRFEKIRERIAPLEELEETIPPPDETTIPLTPRNPSNFSISRTETVRIPSDGSTVFFEAQAQDSFTISNGTNTMTVRVRNGSGGKLEFSTTGALDGVEVDLVPRAGGGYDLTVTSSLENVTVRGGRAGYHPHPEMLGPPTPPLNDGAIPPGGPLIPPQGSGAITSPIRLSQGVSFRLNELFSRGEVPKSQPIFIDVGQGKIIKMVRRVAEQDNPDLPDSLRVESGRIANGVFFIDNGTSSSGFIQLGNVIEILGSLSNPTAGVNGRVVVSGQAFENLRIRIETTAEGEIILRPQSLPSQSPVLPVPSSDGATTVPAGAGASSSSIKTSASAVLLTALTTKSAPVPATAATRVTPTPVTIKTLATVLLTALTTKSAPVPATVATQAPVPAASMSMTQILHVLATRVAPTLATIKAPEPAVLLTALTTKSAPVIVATRVAPTPVTIKTLATVLLTALTTKSAPVIVATRVAPTPVTIKTLATVLLTALTTRSAPIAAVGDASRG